MKPGHPDSDDNSLPFLGDPNMILWQNDLPSISPDWCGCLQALINAGEEVIHINIQLTSDYLDIM